VVSERYREVPGTLTPEMIAAQGDPFMLAYLSGAREGVLVRRAPSGMVPTLGLPFLRSRTLIHSSSEVRRAVGRGVGGSFDRFFSEVLASVTSDVDDAHVERGADENPFAKALEALRDSRGDTRDAAVEPKTPSPEKTSPPEKTVPILYLPNVSRQLLRSPEECPEELKPLVELQYRGAVWNDEWTSRGIKQPSGSWGYSGDNRREPMLEVLEYLRRVNARVPHASLVWFTNGSPLNKRNLMRLAEIRNTAFVNVSFNDHRQDAYEATTGEDVDSSMTLPPPGALVIGSTPWREPGRQPPSAPSGGNTPPCSALTPHPSAKRPRREALQRGVRSGFTARRYPSRALKCARLTV
jgi:hypothetical protein